MRNQSCFLQSLSKLFYKYKEWGNEGITSMAPSVRFTLLQHNYLIRRWQIYYPIYGSSGIARRYKFFLFWLGKENHSRLGVSLNRKCHCQPEQVSWGKELVTVDGSGGTRSWWMPVITRWVQMLAYAVWDECCQMQIQRNWFLYDILCLSL